MDPATGNVILDRSLDYELEQNYKLEILVTVSNQHLIFYSKHKLKVKYSLPELWFSDMKVVFIPNYSEYL